MWKEIAILLAGGLLFSLPSIFITIKLMSTIVGDDYEIVKPKIKGEDNILQVLQSNKKEVTNTNNNMKKKRIRLLKRRNK